MEEWPTSVAQSGQKLDQVDNIGREKKGLLAVRAIA